MFLKDEAAMDYLAGAILVIFPWLGLVLGTWGFMWETLMLLAVFLVGYRRGLLVTLVFLLVGYVLPTIALGASVYNQMSLVPLAGLLGVLGSQKRWPTRVTFFWGAALAAVLGVLPTLSFVAQGFDAQTVTALINSTVQQYQTSGLMTVLQQQGFSEEQVRELMQQGIHIYTLILPSFAALVSLIEFGIVFFLVRYWFKVDEEGRTPFTRWRLPWYAVWGAVLGISCYLLGDQFSWNFLRGLGINLMVVYGALTLVLGTSLYFYLLKSPKIPLFLKFAIIITSVIYLFFSVVSLIMFGLFDLLFNFRRLPEES